MIIAGNRQQKKQAKDQKHYTDRHFPEKNRDTSGINQEGKSGTIMYISPLGMHRHYCKQKNDQHIQQLHLSEYHTGSQADVTCFVIRIIPVDF